jgi:hypothetical protein
MGRRYALARPALCTLYYSLRLISTNPVGPSLKRPWPVHYIIGWMGAYIKHIIGDKVKKPHILFYNHCSRRPMMANTMFRTPSASILKKHLIFCAKMLIFFGVLTRQVTQSNQAHSHPRRSAEYFIYLFVVVYFPLGELICVLLSHITLIVWLGNSRLIKSSRTLH